jgi:hypothetical protein
MADIINWVQTNWIGLVAALWALETLISIVAPLTPWKWDDSIGRWLGSILAKFFPKK